MQFGEGFFHPISKGLGTIGIGGLDFLLIVQLIEVLLDIHIEFTHFGLQALKGESCVVILGDLHLGESL